MEINIWNKTYDDIEKFLLEIHLKDRKTNYTFNTGEFGMVLFSKAIQEKLDGKYHIVALKYEDIKKELVKGTQFVTYTLPNGIELTIQHDPMLDKKEDINEITGFPNKSSTLYYEES